MLAVAIGLLSVCCASARADYPIASHRYLADPSSLVVGDRVYVYCSNDDESKVEGSYNIPSVVCISSSDMKNWTDHGEVFRAERETTWAKKTWAPAAIERDGMFFLYFGNGGANIGVVAGDSPIGPFKDSRGGHLIDGRTPGVQPAPRIWLFDPCAFIDDDGQAYLYFGGNGDDNVRVAELNRDMVSVDGDVIKMHAPNFFEAAWVWKRNGVYYFAYSTTPRAQMRIDYMTSVKPTEGFTYRGIIAAQPPINDNNNHAAQFEFKGQSYHVYHNRIVAKEAGIPTGFRRNIALERFEYDADGSIKQLTYTTDGVPQVGHLDPYERVEAETFATQQGVETERCQAGGMNLTDLQNGDWVRIRGVDFGGTPARKFKASIACDDTGGGNIELRIDGPDGKVIGTCTVESTGGWQKWIDVSCDVTEASGVHDVYLKFVGGNEKPLFNVDHWTFER
jgi:arabinoxylan arabinofuranohydrolase